MRRARWKSIGGVLPLLLAFVACGCAGPKPLDPAAGKAPAAKVAETSAALTPENFDKIGSGAASAEIDALLGKGQDAPSPPAFYKQASASEVESEFGVKRWREWWSSSTGVTITVGFDESGKALVKQLDEGSKVRFVGWKQGQEVVRTAGS